MQCTVPAHLGTKLYIGLVHGYLHGYLHGKPNAMNGIIQSKTNVQCHDGSGLIET